MRKPRQKAADTPYLYTMKNKIELSDKELELLLLVLNEAQDHRAGMGCNDAYKKEKNLFTLEERQKMVRIAMLPKDWKISDIEDAAEEGYLSNFQYVDYLINKIKSQINS